MQRPPLDATDGVTAAIQTLFRLGGSRRIHQQQTTAAGVSLSQQGLRLLERVIEAEPTTPSQLASKMDLDPAVVTRLLRQLEGGGLVTRGRSESDGRVSTVEATPRGQEAFLQVRDVIWDQVRRALSDWAQGDLVELSSLLSKLVSDVQREPYQPLSAPSGKVRSNVSPK